MIKSAAIIHKNIIYTGFSHSQIGLKMLEDKVCEPPYPSSKFQGFMTNDGRFVDRETALKIAIKAGQVVEGKTSSNIMLFSEDLNFPK
jgi:hypothetical protein